MTAIDAGSVEIALIPPVDLTPAPVQPAPPPPPGVPLCLAEEGHAAGYYTDPTDPTEARLAGVTTAQKKGLPPYLVEWAARKAAEYAIDSFAEWSVFDRDTAVGLIAGAPTRDRDSAGAKGTIVHSVMDHAANGTAPDMLFDAEVAPYVSAGLKFLDEWRPSFVWTEATVFGPGYAGTLDAIVDVVIDGAPTRLIIDYKTSRRVYSDVAVQLAAYRFASHAVAYDDNGDLQRVEIPEVDGGAVVHIRADGTYEFRLVKADEVAYRAFVNCLGIASWKDERGVLGDVLDRVQAGGARREPAPPDEIPASRREWVRGRIVAISEAPVDPADLAANGVDSAVALLRHWWPEGVPTLAEFDGHTDHDLDRIAQACSWVESTFRLAFPPPDPGAVVVKVDEALIEALRGRIAALPSDYVAEVEVRAVEHGIVSRLTARTSAAQYEDLVGIVEGIEGRWSGRLDRVEEILAALAATLGREDLSPFLDVATGRASTYADVLRLTGDEVARLDALLVATAAGWITLDDPTNDPENVPGEGDVVMVTDEAARVLIGVVWSNKREALSAGKRAAKSAGLDSPRTYADLVGSPLLVALTLAPSLDGTETPASSEAGPTTER